MPPVLEQIEKLRKDGRVQEAARLAATLRRGPYYALGAGIRQGLDHLTRPKQPTLDTLKGLPEREKDRGWLGGTDVPEPQMGAGPQAAFAALPNTYKQPEMGITQYMGDGAYRVKEQPQVQSPTMPSPSGGMPPATSPPGVRRPPIGSGSEHQPPPRVPTIQTGYGNTQSEPPFTPPNISSTFGGGGSSEPESGGTPEYYPPIQSSAPGDEWQGGGPTGGSTEVVDSSFDPTASNLPPGFDPTTGGGMDVSNLPYDPYREWLPGTGGADKAPEGDQSYEDPWWYYDPDKGHERGLAIGGIVQRPTRALIGEDEPEYVVPESKLDEFTAITAATGEAPDPAEIPSTTSDPANARGMMGGPPPTSPPRMAAPVASAPSGPPPTSPPGIAPRSAPTLAEPPVRPTKISALRRIAAGALGAAANARGGVAGMVGGGVAGAMGQPSARGVAGLAQEAILYPGHAQKMEQYKLGQERAKQQADLGKATADTAESIARARLYGQQADTLKEEGKRGARADLVVVSDGLYDAGKQIWVREPSDKNAVHYREVDLAALGIGQGKVTMPVEAIGPFITSKTKAAPLHNVSPGQTVLGSDNQPVYTAPPKQPDKIPGRDIPLPKDVEEQRKRMNAQRAMQNGLSPNQSNQAQTLASKYGNEAIVKNYNVLAEKAASIREVLNSGNSGPNDLAVVYDFMKVLDPTSVVRESEFANAAKSGNIFTGALARFNGMFDPRGGTLSPQVKADFLKIVEQKMGVSKTQAKRLYEDYARRIDNATKQGGTGKDYLTDYTTLLGGDDSAAPSPAPSGSGSYSSNNPFAPKK